VRIKSFSSSYGNKKSKSELAREKLVQVVVAHVPIEGHNFRPKAVRLQHSVALFAILMMIQVYISLMTRKVIDAIKDPSTLDDKDYYGNKRSST
jgi:DNA-directed RNA polymerase III subunit RPC2